LKRYEAGRKVKEAATVASSYFKSAGILQDKTLNAIRHAPKTSAILHPIDKEADYSRNSLAMQIAMKRTHLQKDIVKREKKQKGFIETLKWG
jgi:hypothetical protein